MYAHSLDDLDVANRPPAAHRPPAVGDIFSTVFGWQAPEYGTTWNDAVQIVYARTNHNYNARQGSSYQTEYVTKSDVGSVMDAWIKLRSSNKVSDFNPASSETLRNAALSAQNQIGSSRAPQREKVEAILRELFNAVNGNPQAVAAHFLYPEGAQNLPERAATAHQRTSATNQQATTAKAAEEDDCGIFCTIKKTIKNIFAIPGEMAGAATTSARIMSIAVPVVLITAAGVLIYIVGRKVLQLDSNKALDSYASARTGGIMRLNDGKKRSRKRSKQRRLADDLPMGTDGSTPKNRPPKEYSERATGDVVVGDEVWFERAIFTGSYRNPKWAGNEVVRGKVIRDSYGKDKQQHTFTIELPDGTTTRIKGRNLYRNGVWRKRWDDEAERDRVAAEKHARGDEARARRDERRNSQGGY
jgi:hypothetical protein